MPFILSLDEGTTSTRAIVFDDQGSIQSLAQKEFTQHYPRAGWVEQDPNEIWLSQKEVIDQALNTASLSARDIAAVGITNQRETTVIWDRQTGNPIAPAIVWQDRRTAPLCEELVARGLTKVIQEKTGLVIDSYFSGTKIRWILDHVPGARQRAEAGELAFGTIDSWLIWNLTQGGLHCTDVSNASRTLLLNIHSGDWDDELLELLKIPREILPSVCSSSEIYGEIRVSPLQGVPISGMAGDQQSALFGQMCFHPGLTKNTYGTGCFMLQNTGSQVAQSTHRLLTTIAWKINDKISYALEGSVFVGGAVVQWLRDGLHLIRSAEEINQLAATVPDSGGVFLVPAFTGLGAPHWDPHARGSLNGITRGTTAGHIARAALESIAFQSADLLDAMRADSSQPLPEIRVDGGASRSDLLMQFQADLLGVPVARPVVTESTALGAAYLAGLGVGFWRTTEELAEQYRIERVFEPALDPARAQELRAGWNRAVERAKGWDLV